MRISTYDRRRIRLLLSEVLSVSVTLALAGCGGPAAVTSAGSGQTTLTSTTDARIAGLWADVARVKEMVARAEGAPRPAFSAAALTTQAGATPYRVNTNKNEIQLDTSAHDAYLHLVGSQVFLNVDGNWYTVDGMDPSQVLILDGTSKTNILTVDTANNSIRWKVQVDGNSNGTPGNHDSNQTDRDTDERITLDNTNGGLADGSSAYGGTGNDILTAMHVAALLDSGPGNDIINGSEFKDTLSGGSGDDTIMGNDGDDVLYGGPNDDCLLGGGGNDTIYGGSSDHDQPRDDGSVDHDIILGQEGDDVLYGGPGPDLIDAGPGNDLLVGNQGPDTLKGGDGDDTIYSSQQADYIDGGAGPDVICTGNGPNDNMVPDRQDSVNGPACSKPPSNTPSGNNVPGANNTTANSPPK